jgi:hypothetical protein
MARRVGAGRGLLAGGVSGGGVPERPPGPGPLVEHDLGRDPLPRLAACCYRLT